MKTLSSTGFEQSIANERALSFFYSLVIGWVFFMVAVVVNN
jgi:hypothetical protein